MKNVFYLSHSRSERNAIPCHGTCHTTRHGTKRNGTVCYAALRVRYESPKQPAAKAQEQDDKRVDHLSKNTSDRPKYMTHTGLSSVEVHKNKRKKHFVFEKEKIKQTAYPVGLQRLSRHVDCTCSLLI